MRAPSIASVIIVCGMMAAVVSPASAQGGREHIAAGRAQEYWIGVRCFDLPDVVRAQLAIADDQGVLVDDVVPDSPAEKAGLRRFDVLLSIEGQTLETPRAVAEAVANSEGKEIAIEYLRGGKQHSLKVAPEPRPDFPPSGRDEVERAMRRWLERPDRPMSLRFFHPGMIIPPSDERPAALPDDMTLTIEKKGGRPAEISVERGGESWRATEESLDELPREARLYVERMLGASMHGPRANTPPRKATAEADGGGADDGGADDGGAEQQLQQKLDEIEALKQKIGVLDELKRQIEEFEKLKRQLRR